MKIITPFKFSVTRKKIEKQFNQKGFVLWIMGLSGSGKSTLSNEISKYFLQRNIRYIALDGDTLRSGINSDLGFSSQDRIENLRRSAHIAKISANHGLAVICSFITPQKAHQNLIKKIIGKDLIICYLDASLETCQRRDPKGLYRLAKSGKIQNFTGITQNFSPPVNPKIRIPENQRLSDSIKQINNKLLALKKISYQ
jgi:adenylylsulfate kinase